MTWEFLFFADLLLLLRLGLLLDDAPATPGAWWIKCAIEIAALLALLQLHAATVAAVALSIVVTVVAIYCEGRPRDRNGAHLLLGVLHVLALSVCFGPWTGPLAREWLPRSLAALREWSALGDGIRALLDRDGLRLLLGLLLAANEANLLIRWLLGRLQLKPGATAGIEAAIDRTEFARGRVIGLLERALIYFFVLNGQLGAVGFTLAAKGFTRFKELENRGFAEYVLIGTLLSSGLALLAAVAIKNLG